jgi:hypothetical protein
MFTIVKNNHFMEIGLVHKKLTYVRLASGLVNTSYQIGSALGLAIIVDIASSQTETLENNNGVISIAALNSGFHSAFIGAAIVSVIATITALVALKIRQTGKTTADN